MREIVLDTETTGFDPHAGDRIVEIGAIELHNHLPTGQTFHEYINPEREMPEGAFAVHGLSTEFLADKPVFEKIADAFCAFVGDAPLVIHNATFDMTFLNAELGWVGRAQLPPSQAVDTLEIARRKFPGAQNSLDALCRRFAIDNSAREKHGALLDSELLAEVYLELMGGRQPDLVLSPTAINRKSADPSTKETAAKRPEPLASLLTPDEASAHKAFVEGLGETPLWRKYQA